KSAFARRWVLKALYAAACWNSRFCAGRDRRGFRNCCRDRSDAVLGEPALRGAPNGSDHTLRRLRATADGRARGSGFRRAGQPALIRWSRYDTNSIRGCSHPRVARSAACVPHERRNFAPRLRLIREWVRVALDSMNYGTLPSKFLHAVDTCPSPRAQMFRPPLASGSAPANPESTSWQNISSQEFLRRVAGLSQALFELGVKPGDRVGLFAANRPEWHTADFAINGSGAVTVPVYFKESPERMAYILNHAETRVVFVAGSDQLGYLL